MKALIIIPAYNESESILKTLEDIGLHAGKVDCVVINDCSSDGTEQVLRENHANYISLPCNLGIGGGVQTGYKYAKENGYDLAIQFDGDGQHDARFIRDLVRPLEAGEADIAIGSRFIKKEGFQSTSLRRAGILFLSKLIHALCGVRVLDVTSGMRAVNRRMIELYSNTYAQDYPEPEAILVAAMHGARIMEVPVEMRERQAGKSSINPLRSIYYMIKVSLALILTKATTCKGKS